MCYWEASTAITRTDNLVCAQCTAQCRLADSLNAATSRGHQSLKDSIHQLNSFWQIVFLQNLEEKSMNMLAPIIYWLWWELEIWKIELEIWKINLIGLFRRANSLHASCAIQGHQHKRAYYPACYNEFLSTVSKTGKFLLFWSALALMHFCF